VFGYYNKSTNTTYPLNTTGPGDWIGSSTLFDVSFDSNNNGAYLVGSNGAFGYYNKSDNISYDLSDTDPGDWIGSSTLFDVSFDSNNNGAYLVGADGSIAVFGYHAKIKFFNPKSLGELTSDQQKTVSWTINATGAENSVWTIDVDFTSDNTNISQNDTGDATIKIVGEVLGNAYLRGVALYYYTGERVDGNVTIIPIGDPEGKETITFTSGEWSHNFYLNAENVEYLTVIVYDNENQKIGYSELKLKPEEAELECTIQNISLSGYSVDTSGSSITSGNVKVSVIDTDYTNTSSFSGIWSIDFHPCLISGKIHTLHVLVSDNTGKRGEFLQKYPAR